MEEIAADIIQRILSDLSLHVRKHVQPKGDHPFLAERGRIDHIFWRHAEKTYDAYIDRYNAQAALDAWYQLNLHTRCPQSFIRWMKTYGDPRELHEWSSYTNT